MSEIFAFLYAIIRAIPVVKSLVEMFISWYVSQSINDMKEKDREAIRRAVYEQDQRDLEKQIGDKSPGELSGLPNTGVVDNLPNVLQATDTTGNKR